MYEEIIAGLQRIVNVHKGRLTPFMRETICEAIIAIRKLNKKCLDPDFVHVLRCKDCRYWGRDSHGGICDRYRVRSNKDWFCAGGEKKEV